MQVVQKPTWQVGKAVKLQQHGPSSLPLASQKIPRAADVDDPQLLLLSVQVWGRKCHMQTLMQSPYCAFLCHLQAENDDIVCVQVPQARMLRLQLDNASSLRLMSNFSTVVAAIKPPMTT